MKDELGGIMKEFVRLRAKKRKENLNFKIKKIV